MPMAGVYSQLLSVQGRPARVWRGGRGRPLVLLPGGLGDAATHWRWCWNALADSFTLAAPDLPGFGGMSAALPEPGYQGFVDWTLALLDALELRQVALAGSSFGAAIARLIAAQQPARVSHLVLINGGRVFAPPGPLRALVRLPGVAGMLFNMAAGGMAEAQAAEKAIHDKSRLTPELRAEIGRARPGYVAALRRLALEPAPDQRTPRCQTLVVWGTQDGLAGRGSGERLVREIEGARFQPFEYSGHLPQLEQPDAFVAATRQFINAGG
jgi:pimeloyl-ACP methyl ester carboxylesterase